MFRGCELIKIYIEVNSKIKGNRMIKAVTRSMERMRDLLQQIEVDVNRMNKKKIKLLEQENLNLWDMYSQQLNESVVNLISKLDFTFLPRMKGDRS